MWGPAMLLAHHSGDAVFKETASAMAAAVALPGSPLHTLFAMLSGKGESVFAPSNAPPGAGAYVS